MPWLLYKPNYLKFNDKFDSLGGYPDRKLEIDIIYETVFYKWRKENYELIGDKTYYKRGSNGKGREVVGRNKGLKLKTQE